MKYTSVVDGIIIKWTEIDRFWKGAHGWAPNEAAGLLEISRMDNAVSMSWALLMFNRIRNDDGYNAKMILAWVSLRSLAESALKWFLCVWYDSYRSDPAAVLIIGKLKRPDGLTIEPLIKYYEKSIFGKESSKFVVLLREIQENGNSIHSFKHRNIGSKRDFSRCVEGYREMLYYLDGRVPYP